jgi:hypothetical protein
MHRSRRGAGKGGRFVGACVAVVSAMLLGESYANAQVGDDSMALPSTRVTLPESVQLQNAARGGGQPARFAVPGTSAGLGTTLGINLPRSPGSFDDADRVASQRTPVHGPATSTAGGRRSTNNKTLNVVIAATAGLFLGGYLGAAIEGNRCQCDDPGMVGAMIGAPLGAAAGAVVAVKFF